MAAATEPEDAGILTLFFFPVWRLLPVLLSIGDRVEGRTSVSRRSSMICSDASSREQVEPFLPAAQIL
jgi:hypothetical protein